MLDTVSNANASDCEGRSSRRVVNQSSVHFGTAFWNHQIRCGTTADSKALCIFGRRTDCIWTSQTTPSLSLPTKMLSIGLTVCGTPFAMRRKPTLVKRTSFLSLCPFSLFLPLNQVQRTLAFAAACRGVPIYLLYTRFAPPPWYSSTIGEGNSLRTLALSHALSRVCLGVEGINLHQLGNAVCDQCRFPHSVDGVDQVTTSNHCSTTPIAMQFPRMSRARPAPPAFCALLL